MEKCLFILLIVLPGICYSSENFDLDNVNVDATTIATTTSSWVPNREIPDSGFLDSTADTWADIYGETTTPFSTTPTTAEVTPSVPGEHLDIKTTEQSSREVAPDSEEEEEDSDDDSTSDLSSAEIRKFTQGIMSFSADLLKQVDVDSNKPNVVMSPLSIALGLLQLSLGAGKETEKQLRETLHMESVKCLHGKLKAIRRELTKTALKVATRIYIKKDFHVKKGFLKASHKWYGSKPQNLDKNVQKNLNSINKWVSEATDGKITNFLTQLPADLVLMLLNAIHFKGVWRNKFDPSMTVPDTFHINDHLTVPVEMMNAQKYPLSWFIQESLDSQVARLPFKGNMSFIVIMPLTFDWNISKILDNLNQSELYSRFPKEKPTVLRMPKLTLDFKLELTQTLTKLGLGQLFTNPDLKGISDEALFVSSIQHQSTLELNEEGGEAAASTAILMSRSLATYSINRPFLFFLFDDITGLPLFQGYVRDPNPNSEKKIKEQIHFPDHKSGKKGYLPK
ncbi:alpha-2-antiplasmin [Bombina bombina]|uniref:alpha-2-antiplasmin n=1 Tax=Bombina bombina TaxID=8345 RepID=UPI00235AC999|nr:alpha-2-antiplasmin [Bombina bombina]XP_053562199.1 alpha-2-antiplasmin [Bombina bombina]